MSDDAKIHEWAQRALDKYNGSYTASQICLNGVTYLYDIRNDGNSDQNLAIASHYLHCRYVSSTLFVAGAIVGFVAALGYDGAVKFIDGLLKEHWNKDLVHKFGKAPTSDFEPNMIAWDLQGLSDGVGDFAAEWGNTSLRASKAPGPKFQLRP